MTYSGQTVGGSQLRSYRRSGVEALPWQLLWGLPQHIIECALRPRFQVAIRAIARGSDVDESLHGTSREVHGTGMRLAKSLIGAIRLRANHQVLADDAAAHMPIDHECQAAEHLLLFHRVTASQERSESLS
jgi:hypothetical protein